MLIFSWESVACNYEMVLAVLYNDKISTSKKFTEKIFTSGNNTNI